MKIFKIFFKQKFTIYALVGESGTGKSYHAKLVAQKYGLTALIDDGLLIQDDKIIAGHTAKHEKTYMGAVRIALFDDKEYRDEVAKAIRVNKIKKILIIGTSEKMAKKIAERLQLPPPEKIIDIHSIASDEEIQAAIHSRNVEGRHVIPVAAVQIKRSYPQIFVKSLHDFFTRKGKLKKTATSDSKVWEKSIVAPEFSKKDRVELSEAAVTQMVVKCVKEFNEQVKIKKMTIKTSTSGYKLIVTVDVPFGRQLTGLIRDIQQCITDNLERNSGILVEDVNIIIDRITGFEPKKKSKKKS